MEHRCLRIRLGDGSIYRWKFDKGDKTLVLGVPGAITFDETRFGLSLARRGAGLAYLPEPSVVPMVDTGALRIVLADWASPGPGFHIYYLGRRHFSTALRLLIDLIREIRPLGP